MAENGSASSLKQFIASISTIKGDLSNITAPPFVLADKSTTEFPRYWIEHPDLFYAPALEKDPARRLLAVLKWFLASLKGQQYAGRDPEDGIKKPLNAFLGEVFVGECGSKDNITRLVSEQVCHHPPVTACCLWNEKHGVHAEGFTRQEITFSGSVNIQQIGYALLHLDAYDEDYLVPLPNVKVTGVITGKPYPELQGTYHIPSSSGLVAEIDFSGKKVLGLTGKKNHLEARIYRADDQKQENVLYQAEGSWSEAFVLSDGAGKEIENYNVSAASGEQFRTAPREEQDPWESRRAWGGVIDGIHAGDMQAVADFKSAVENGQRELRKQPEHSEEKWQTLFFRKEQTDDKAQRLLQSIGQSHDPESTKGIWKFDREAAASLQKPWRGRLTPQGEVSR